MPDLSICVFGDSVSKGVIFDSALKKYTLLKDSFVNRIRSGAGIAVTNYSKFGCTVTKGLDMLRRHKNELNRYDYTVFEFGGNDCDFNWREVSSSPDGEHYPNTPVTVFEQKYADLISEVEKGGSHPVLLTLPPIDAKRYFAWVSQGLNSSGILHWLGDVDLIYRYHEMYNLAICRLAKEFSVPLIDISSAFLETPNYQKLLCEDGIHPNESGHRLITKAIDRILTRIQRVPA